MGTSPGCSRRVDTGANPGMNPPDWVEGVAAKALVPLPAGNCSPLGALHRISTPPAPLTSGVRELAATGAALRSP